MKTILDKTWKFEAPKWKSKCSRNSIDRHLKIFYLQMLSTMNCRDLVQKVNPLSTLESKVWTAKPKLATRMTHQNWMMVDWLNCDCDCIQIDLFLAWRIRIAIVEMQNCLFAFYWVPFLALCLISKLFKWLHTVWILCFIGQCRSNSKSRLINQTIFPKNLWWSVSVHNSVTLSHILAPSLKTD